MHAACPNYNTLGCFYKHARFIYPAFSKNTDAVERVQKYHFSFVPFIKKPNQIPIFV